MVIERMVMLHEIWSKKLLNLDLEFVLLSFPAIRMMTTPIGGSSIGFGFHGYRIRMPGARPASNHVRDDFARRSRRELDPMGGVLIAQF